ncbi:response regulator [Deinococcus pimensis]|uniref:response regulator n=1 Tax=Deinococcus pimensis TaxID=309888 RepID=UPI0004BC0D4D|nr:response regulator [Deinococcus pimensis]
MLRTATLLLVEDNEGYAYLTERVLRRVAPTLKIVTARSAEEALTLVATRRPDLILLDLLLPDMSGLDLLRALRSEPVTTGVPVIVFSAYPDDANVRGAYSLLANAYLVKPEDVDELDATMRAFCEFWLQRALLPSGPPTH